MKKEILNKILPHLIAFGAFFLIIFIYFSPVISGKVLVQSDVVQSAGTLKEANTYQEKTGEEILWSNSMFSGMPVWRGFSNNVLNVFHNILVAIFPIPVLLCFLSFAGFYILLQVFRVNIWLSFAGSVAYTFSTFSIISIEAGHINKVFDMALMAPVLAGVALTFRGNLWLGTALSIIAAGLQINYGHLQITYYLLFIILFYGVAEFIHFLLKKQLIEFLKRAAMLLIAAIIAVGPNFSRLYTNYEYVKYSTRGGSELTTAQNKDGGLDKDYALSWSNGILETMTLIIPGFYGGSSHEELGLDSKTYKTLTSQGVPKNNSKEFIGSAPLYWGDQPFTSGPVYIGAIICFLFVLGVILIKSRLKWWVLGVSLLAIMLSWGKNFDFLTDIFFNYVPLYNKFRSVTMIHAIIQVTSVLLGIVAVQKIISGEVTKQEALKGIKLSAIVTGGLTLFFVLFGPSLFDFTSDSDKNLPVEWLKAPLIEDRKDYLRDDALRSLVFILLAAGILWAFALNKIKAVYLYAGLTLLILIDLWSVDKRYLGKDDFRYNKNFEKKVFIPTKANELILQDPDPNFRVFNLTVNPFSDAITSYYHKSIGGYSAIKLGRYQELIDHQLSKNNMAVLNMLNTKYFIVTDRQTQEPMVQRNPDALGNAWFVDSIRIVKNADEEIQALSDFNPETSVIIDQRFSAYIENLTKNRSNGSIKLTSYHPNRLRYQSDTDTEQFAVFSEIYFSPGWQAYVDNKPVDHIRVNYVLRGMKVPPGKHVIDFKFEPQFYFTAEKISRIGSVIFILALVLIYGGVIYYSINPRSKS